MGGQAVLDAEQLLQLGTHLEKGLRSGIGVVRHQHGGLLPVGHGVDAGIRQHVQENIPVVQLEGVEPRLPHLVQPLLRGQQVQLLDDLYLVHLHGDGFMFVKCNGGHNALLLGQNSSCRVFCRRSSGVWCDLSSRRRGYRLLFRKVVICRRSFA